MLWRNALLLATGALWLTSCNKLTPEEIHHRQAEDFFKTYLAFSPIAATAAGYHHHQGVALDAILDDYSKAALDGERVFFNQAHVQADDLSRKTITAESHADLDLIRLVAEGALLELDKIQSYRHNPTLYVEAIGNAIYNPYLLNYAPESVRFGHIIARLEKTPAFLAQAKQNLVDSPDIWNQVAQQGNIRVINDEVRAKVPASLKSEYSAAAETALAALDDFQKYLRNDLKKHRSSWRLGKENYAQKLRLTLAAGQTPEELLKTAEAELAEIQGQMQQEALAVFPKYYPGEQPPAVQGDLIRMVLEKVSAQHANPDTYIADAKRDLAEATAFVKEQHLLALPARNNLQVIPTPEFMRGIYSVGGFASAPPLEPQLGAFYWITPISADMSPERVESKLRENNFWGLKILTIHEAMPGHYVQAEYANSVQPAWRASLRALFSNGPCVEGWAVYVTQLMIEKGYQDSPEMRLMFGKQLLRVISNSILDVRMHTMNMSDDEAMGLMLNGTFQEREEATNKLQRAKLSSCQLPTYFVGWQGWEALRADYMKRKGKDFKEAEFHERALAEGALPLSMLSKLLLSPTQDQTQTEPATSTKSGSQP
jgi:uncharacterized protein (DUF885 family)